MLQLKNQSAKEKQQIEQLLLHQLTQSDLWHKAKTIGITISMDLEWDTKEIIKEAWIQNKTVCAPKSNPNNHQLAFYTIDTFQQVEQSSYGLLEPIPALTTKVNQMKIDLMIVPGIVFDLYGFRIGFGGGYYDRLLMDFPHKTCSLVSEKQLVDQLPSESHDIPIHYLITEKGILKGKV